MTRELISSLILGLALLGSAWILQGRMGHPTPNPFTPEHSLAVQGEGKVSVKPDTFLVSVSIEEKALTTTEAFSKTNEKLVLAKKVLTDNTVAEKDITSANVSLSPSYDYSSGKTTIDGFISRHVLAVKVRDLTKVDAILSGISAVNGLEIQSTSFDLDDTTPVYREARKLAIEKASQKAHDIATTSQIRLGKIISISENEIYHPPFAQSLRNSFQQDMMTTSSAGSSVSAGQMEISVSVAVTYTIE